MMIIQDTSSVNSKFLCLTAKFSQQSSLPWCVGFVAMSVTSTATAMPILSKSFRCIDFDMRGYGQSERPFQRYDTEVWADDVAGLMDHPGLRNAHIHGTSMGGMVAKQFAGCDGLPER
jgi:pimeloyl-ACP methyl ester carboxylesterase